jgi:hypothetical protein
VTKRLIIGRHPLDGSYGIWLSNPGIDATTTVNPVNFLICPGVKNDMVLMSGSAVGGQTVFFPFALSITPVVLFNCTSSNGADWYPFDIGQITKSGNVACTVTQSYFTFSDSTGQGLTFLYLVTNRRLV